MSKLPSKAQESGIKPLNTVKKMEKRSFAKNTRTLVVQSASTRTTIPMIAKKGHCKENFLFEKKEALEIDLKHKTFNVQHLYGVLTRNIIFLTV